MYQSDCEVFTRENRAAPEIPTINTKVNLYFQYGFTLESLSSVERRGAPTPEIGHWRLVETEMKQNREPNSAPDRRLGLGLQVSPHNTLTTLNTHTRARKRSAVLRARTAQHPDPPGRRGSSLQPMKRRAPTPPLVAPSALLRRRGPGGGARGSRRQGALVG